MSQMQLDRLSLAVEMRQRLHRYFELFNRLNPKRQNPINELVALQLELSELASANIRFEDPFGSIVGTEALSRYLLRFSKQVPELKFELLRQGWDGDDCLVLWRFSGQSRWFGDQQGQWCFDGVSRIEFDQQGYILSHTDYWDAGAAVYQRLPILGRLIGRIRRRLHQG